LSVEGEVDMRLYHYLEAQLALEGIRKRRLRVSKIQDTNDPYEFACVRSKDEQSQQALDKFARGWFSDMRVQCFGRSWNNVVMWSHYGDRHRGICLGFDVPDERVREVKYVGDIMVVGRLRRAVANENDELLERLLWAKYDGWSYEQEVRSIGQKVNMIEDGGEYFVPFGRYLCLKEVIAGARFSMKRSVIDEALGGYPGVLVVKAKCSPTSFGVIADERGFIDGETTY
jgi:hypothetical protein